MLKLYRPELNDLWFRQELLNDPDTMSYNEKWGGTISFPKEKWSSWYERWVCDKENKHFYSYLQDTETNDFVGETAYHYDEARKIFICDIIVLARLRGKGCGTEGLKLLCGCARNNGVDVIYDDIAADNPSVNLFLKNGFVIDYQTDEIVMVKKELKK
ncbi:MAG: GNAT family N-acetyltransferase [Ruminococcaceae bacterium]|nr:GNAT family N-acetyltransferase [Oscillospiraceae bacterium]